ncbi:MAG: cation:proton antiporter [Acidobacteriota bacterium]|nr:cation:proton antiporter [Acidobacteriota bacterium]
MTLGVSFVLAILGVATFVGPLIGERLQVPGAVIEILLGFALSFVLPHADYATNGIVATLGSLGFLILMFLVGVEFDLAEIRGASRSASLMGIVLLTSSFLVSWLLLGRLAGASSMWVLAGAATSVGVTVPVLHVRGWMGARFARDVLMVGAVAEIGYLVALNVLSVASRHDSAMTAILLGTRALAFIGFSLFVVFLIRRLRVKAPRHFHRWFLRDDPLEVGLRGTFALLFVVVASCGLLHIPNVLGAVLAGVIFRSVIGHAKAIVERVTSVANAFLIPLFFLDVGLQTPLRSDVEGLAPVAALVLLVLSVPRLVVVPYLRRRGNSWRVSFAGAASLMAPLTLLVTTAQIGKADGFIGPRNYTAIILVAVVSAIIFPSVARGLLPHRRDEGSREDRKSPAPTRRLEAN